MLDLNSSTEGLSLLPKACVRDKPWGTGLKQVQTWRTPRSVQFKTSSAFMNCSSQHKHFAFKPLLSTPTGHWGVEGRTKIGGRGDWFVCKLW